MLPRVLADVALAIALTALDGYVFAADHVGGLRRLAAPLVMGTAATAAAVVISSGQQLASMPPWMWLVVGGLGLLVLAFGTERAVNSEHTDAGTVLDAVRDRFE